MKKLLSILGVIGIVASSSTTVVSCGGKPTNNNNNDNDNEEDNDNFDLTPEERSAFDSTSDIAKAVALGKSENLGSNHVDVLGGYKFSPAILKIKDQSPNLIGRIKNTTTYNPTKLQQRMLNHFSYWGDNFTSNVDNESNSFLDGQDGLSTTDFIKEGRLLKDDSNYDDSLNFLLSDTARMELNSGSSIANYSENLPENITDRDAIAQKTSSSNLIMQSVASQLQGVLKNPTAEGIIPIVQLFSTVFPIETTNTGPGIASGLLTGLSRTIFFATTPDEQKDNDYSDEFFAKTVDGSTTGLISWAFEQEYNYLIKNRNKLGISNDQFKLLVGTPNEENKIGQDYKLITNVYNNDTSVYERAPAYTSKAVWYEAVENSGIYGDLINAIGKLKFHNAGRDEYNKESDKYDKGYANSLTPDAPNDYYAHRQFLAIDNDAIDVFEKTFSLYNISKNILSNETSKNMMDIIWEKVEPLTKRSEWNMLGIPVTSNNIGSFIDMIFDACGLFVGFNGNGDVNYADVNDIERYYGLNGNEKPYSEEMQKSLIDATKYIDTEDKDDDGKVIWDGNTAYQEAVYKAFGVDNIFKNPTIIKDGFYSRFISKADEYYNTIFANNEADVTYNWLEDFWDTNWMSNASWKESDINIEYGSNKTISKLTYTLEYTGLGSDEVADFKASDEVSGLSQSEIYEKIRNAKPATEDESEFKKSFNGTGLISDLKNVDHKYTVTFVNDSNNGDYDFKLSDFTNQQAYINNTWKSFSF
jgi:hypothetical protein